MSIAGSARLTLGMQRAGLCRRGVTWCERTGYVVSDDDFSAAPEEIDGFKTDVIEKLRDKVVSEACPFRNTINRFFMGRIRAINAMNSTVPRGLVTYIFACTNCGFIRQHLRPVVDGEVSGEVSCGSE